MAATQEQLLEAKRARTKRRHAKRKAAVAARTVQLTARIKQLKKKIENRDKRIGSLATELDELKRDLVKVPDGAIEAVQREIGAMPSGPMDGVGDLSGIP